MATLCHLGNIARRLGRRLKWDPVKEIFPGDDEANGYIDVPKRKGYELPTESLESPLMTWRFVYCSRPDGTVVAGLANMPWRAEEKSSKETSGKEATRSSIGYVPLDAPSGMSQAVIVQGLPLVHTRQLLPLDASGKVVGEGSADKQIEPGAEQPGGRAEGLRVGLGQAGAVERLRLSTATVSSVRELLNKRLGPAVRPAVTAVLTPLTHRKVLVAVDAVAAGGPVTL